MWLCVAAISAFAADPAPAANDGTPEPYSTDERSFWSLVPRVCAAVPEFAADADRSWIRGPLDAFVLAALRDKGLGPAPAADRRTLARRLWFDLLGLPPSPEDLDAFEHDPSPAAYEALVERLLADPRYGERWGQHWLDVVRFAETEGFEYDSLRPGAWRYRDWVVRALADDMPFDRFLTAQLAGDELAATTDDPLARDALLVAAGFHRLGPVRRNAGNAEVAFSRHEVLTEMTDAVGSVFLGTTLGCARCHDHKFDAIRQRDYYRLQAFLAATHERDVSLAPSDVQRDWKIRTDELKARIKAVNERLAQATGAEEPALKQELADLEDALPAPLEAISTVVDDGSRRTAVHRLFRGEEARPREAVGSRVLGVLLADDVPESPADLAAPKTVLARWLADPAHPLTARVIVNRIWSHHFGTGLVATDNDFGVNGDQPSHPELLDRLADDFVAQEWRWKPLHRTILLSSTYRQASVVSREQERVGRPVDPGLRLLWRSPRRRLDAESLRDALLTVSGRLNPRPNGPSVIVPVEKELTDLLYKPSQWTVTADVGEHDRRSLWLLAKRNLREPFLQVFDQPDLQQSCPRRAATTHAPQALELLNGRVSNACAATFADRLRRECGDDPARQVDRGFLLATGRPPTPAQRTRALEFLAREPLREFALALFNLDAFAYVD
jgi:hypothetical protein